MNKMAEYIGRQAAIDMFQRLSYDDWNQGVGTTWANAFEESADLVESLPPADVEPVVRCIDCKHNNGGYCHNDGGFAHFDHFVVQDDDYCSRGEREGGDANAE